MNNPNSQMITVKGRYGEYEVSKDVVISFPSGIIGFPNSKDFIVLEYKEPFSFLQSVEEVDVSFVVIDGFDTMQSMNLKSPIGDAEIDLKEGDEFAVMLIVTIRNDPRDNTVNLKAPIFVNLKNRKGVQIIYDDQRLSTREPLWDEAAIKAMEETARIEEEALKNSETKGGNKEEDKK